MSRLVAVTSILLAAALPAAAQSCRLALLLAVDVSSSVDADEYRLQMDGLAAALISPVVQDEILSRPGMPVALAVYEFSGRYQQETVLNWRILYDAGDIVTAAETIAGAVRSETEFPTSIGYAIGHAASLFRTAPLCVESKLDLSGDGRNNEGFKPALAYRHFPLGGVTVNALAIGGSENPADLAQYYATEVIKGPGAFVEIATDYSAFQDAMERKLLRELRTQVIGQLGP